MTCVTIHWILVQKKHTQSLNTLILQWPAMQLNLLENQTIVFWKQFLNDFTLFWCIVSCQTMIYIYYNVPSTVILLLMCRRTTLRQNVLCSKKNCEKYDYVIFVWKWSNEVHKIYGIIAKVSKMAELLVYYIIPWPGMSEFWDDISWCYICYVTFRNLFCKANVKISAFLWFLFLRLPCK